MSIDYTKHKDKRVNNPTMEHRDFFVAEEKKPFDTLYPRDPSLDPQLVWKGKDEQDREDLAVPTVPIYIQEKIHPSAIIEDLRRNFPPGARREGGGAGGGDQQRLDLFGDFNHMELEPGVDPFEAQLDFYSHRDERMKSWTNRMILGDSLLVMNSLAEKEGLKGKVQCIYIDPPYGIKFGSNWQVSTRKRNVKDGKVADATREPEVVRAFRDTWALGIYSYLSYLRDRFRVARELLTETGSIFVQIGEENVHLVRCVLDEVFGSENFVSQVSYATTGGFDTLTLSRIGDYLVWFAKDVKQIKYRQLYVDKGSVLDQQKSKYDQVELEDGTRRRISRADKENALPRGARVYRLDNMFGQGDANEPTPFVFAGRTYNPPENNHWKANYPDGVQRLASALRIQKTGDSLAYVRFLDDLSVQPISNTWTDISGTVQSRAQGKIFVVQTSTSLLERCMLMATDPGDLVLDPTCGSGTTAYVAEQWGRRWITIDTSRVALALARTRLMSARFPYYLLADSPAGVKKEGELTGQVPPSYPTAGDVKKGFVYERVPHVTLKSIANNPDIKEGMTREQIDKAIARHAETELLYDKPYQDKKRVRVTGPFTVESLSPHRVLPAEDQEQPAAEAEAARDDAAADFTTMVLENLRKAGVQNTKKGERLKFDTITPFAGAWVHAVGEYTQTSTSSPSPSPAPSSGQGEGRTMRVAISIGPEYNAVSPHQIKEAAKEAVKGVGFDLLVVCGYAFDPHVSEEAKQYGALTVLPAKITEDLRMGDDVLKKTGAGNLFMVFGEPDLEVTRVPATSTPGPSSSGAGEGEKIVVELRGLDVYDPTTGVIRGGRALVQEGYEQVDDATDDVACWFIDTNYNGESFFVRHAYFVGADKPYEKLAKTLRATIDEAAWSSLYSTRSRPFDPPETGKIAVKVINHYGDEVLKVYDLAKV